MAEQMRLLPRPPTIHVQETYRAGLRTGGVANTLLTCGVVGAGIYDGFKNGWNQRVPYIIFAIGSLFGLNAIHNWLGVYWTRTRAITPGDLEKATGSIDLEFYRARERVFLEALNEIGEALEASQSKDLGEKNLGARSLDTAWGKIRGSIQTLATRPAGSAPQTTSLTATQTTSLTKETLESVVRDLEQSNGRLMRGIEGKVDLEANLGESILSVRELGACTEAWKKLDKALQQRQKLLMHIEITALKKQQFQELLGCLGEIQKSLEPLGAKFPSNVNVPVPTKYTDRELNGKWHAIQCALAAIQEGLGKAVQVKQGEKSEVELQQTNLKQLEELRGELERTKKTLSEKEQALQTMTSAHAEAIKALQQRLESAQAALSTPSEEHTRAMTQLREQLAAAQLVATGAREELEKANAKVKAKEDEISDLKTAHTRKTEELSQSAETTRKQLSEDHKRAMGQLQEQLAAAQQGATGAREELGKATAKVEEKDRELKELKEAHATEMEKSRTSATALESRLTQDKSQAVEKLQKELRELKQKHDSEKRKLEDDLGSTKAELREKTEALGKLQTEFAAMSAKNEENAGKYKEYKEKTRSLNVKIDEKGQEIRTLTAQLEEKNVSIGEIIRWIKIANEALREASAKTGNSLDDSFEAIEELKMPGAMHPCYNLISSLNVFIRTMNTQMHPQSQQSSAESTPVQSPSGKKPSSRLKAALLAASISPQNSDASSENSPVPPSAATGAKKQVKKTLFRREKSPDDGYTSQ